MATCTYTFGDILTGAIIEEIPLYGVNIIDKFEGGQLTGTFQFDQTGKDNEALDAATIPGRCYVVVEREGVPIWGGYVQNRLYQSQAKSAQLFCKGWETYPERRLVRQSFSFTDTDQIEIFRTLWLHMQEIDRSAILFDVFPDFASGVRRDLEIGSEEFKTYAQIFSQIADGDDGFDWRVSIVRTGGVYQKKLLAGFPTLGEKQPDNLTFEYPGNVLNYWKNETMSDSGTHFYTLGAGEGADMLTNFVGLVDLLDNGFPRWDVTISKKDVTDVGLLASIGSQEASNRRAPMPVFTLQVKASVDPVFGGYSIGDACQVVIKDPKHPKGYERETRLLQWEYTPQTSDSTEEALLTFEGDDNIG